MNILGKMWKLNILYSKQKYSSVVINVKQSHERKCFIQDKTGDHKYNIFDQLKKIIEAGSTQTDVIPTTSCLIART